MGHALIVEDNADAARMVATLVAGQGFSAATAPSLLDARRQLALQPPDLLLLDLQLPDGNGLSLLDDPDLGATPEVVLMTGHASLETSIAALRHGALDYLVKPVSAQQIHAILARVMPAGAAGRGIPQRPGRSAGPAGGPGHGPGGAHFGHLVGRSQALRQVFDQITRVAGTGLPVFITGESGTGKELVARTLHDMSRRKARPFLAVNCGAISPHLIESEIFGHERGSFTGAERQHQGFFERTDGGTLFLDEITEMPLAMQVKLLRVLESGSFMRVGSAVAQECDVRLVAASNRDLAQAVAQGALREDLLYRLNVFPIELPPLRERRDDIPLLADHFLRQLAQREGTMRSLGPQALEALSRHTWPGNVRELRNVLQRAWVMASGDEIDAHWLPRSDAGRGAQASGPAAALSVPLGTPLAAVERQVILATLSHFDQHKERTAAALGVSLKTLYNRLKEYGG